MEKKTNEPLNNVKEKNELKKNLFPCNILSVG